jgi:hypothetical protein
MDTLKAKVVKRSEIPAATHRIQGRTGEIWTLLLALPDDEVLEVQNRDKDHAQNTKSHLREIAKRAGRKLLVEQRGSTVYFWFEDAERRAVERALSEPSSLSAR